MPTIDDLAPVVSVSDNDELIVSQSGVARKATRAQVVSGLQPDLAVFPGSLLGRFSPGVGAPEPIALGANLTLANGTMSAPAAFDISAISAAGPVGPTDLVPLGQGGQNTAVPYGAFMSGLSSVDGVDGSGLLAFVAGAPAGRRVAEIFADAVTVEMFGAVGDGVTDDSVAFGRAIASGRVLRLDGRVYVVDAALSIDGLPAMIGVPGATVLRRISASGLGPWVVVAAPAVFVSGVTFDAGSLGAFDNACVSVAVSCLNATFSACGFLGANGSSNGCGLMVVGTAGSAIAIRECFASGNGSHGIFVDGSGTLTVTGSTCSGNGGDGIHVAAGVQARLTGNFCAGNTNGIAVGNWGAGAPPSSAGLASNVSANSSQANRNWGLALAASGAIVSGNSVIGNGTVTAGGGIRMLLAGSHVSDNIVSGGAVGIDARGAAQSTVVNNHVSGTLSGILPGGSQGLRIAGNMLSSNGWGIYASAIEPTLAAVPTANLAIDSNDISFATAQGVGIAAMDGVQGVSITGNRFTGSGSANIGQALWLHTDAAIVFGNRWNSQPRPVVGIGTIGGSPAIVVPDVADGVLVTDAGIGIESVMTSHQVDTLGQIAFIKVTNGGAGYSSATVAIAGSGSGAAASAIVANGIVVWIVVANPGSGYGPISTEAAVTILGDGTGATATAYVGLPVLDGRCFRIVANAAIEFTRDGSSPPQTCWSGYNFTIPANGAVEFEGVFGQWRGVLSPPIDYVQPTGDGGAVIQSAAGGALTLRPGSGGALNIASSDEPAGYQSCVGRGSPEGIVAAPPGSDFRNLDGGAGTTLWLKQTGSGATGWQAVA